MAETASAKRGPREVRAAVEAAWWLGVAGTLLCLVPFGRLFRVLPDETPVPALDAHAQALVARVRWAVGAAADRLPWHPNCLPRAFAGILMCRVRGLRVPMALSVAHLGRGFGAHAKLDPGSDAELAATIPEGRTHLGRVALVI